MSSTAQMPDAVVIWMALFLGRRRRRCRLFAGVGLLTRRPFFQPDTVTKMITTSCIAEGARVLQDILEDFAAVAQADIAEQRLPDGGMTG